MERQEAELVAIRALGWMAADDELWTAFLSVTGVAPAEVRARAAEPEFLFAVLEFLTADERRVTAFAQAAGLPPDAALRARRALPGGDEMHWT